MSIYYKLREAYGDFIKEDFQKGLQPILYCFWTGTNKMSSQRKQALNSLANTQMKVVLITPSNLHEYILADAPLHRSYKYLSEVHQADYLRCYFMNFHGGGYSDIKHTTKSWRPSYNLLNKKDIWGIGYKELGPSGVATIHNNPKLNQILHKEWSKLIGNCCYIFKPNTPFTNEWYEKMMSLMNKVGDDLKKYPAKHPQQAKDRDTGYQYPLRWASFNEITHIIFYKYHKY